MAEQLKFTEAGNPRGKSKTVHAGPTEASHRLRRPGDSGDQEKKLTIKNKQ